MSQLRKGQNFFLLVLGIFYWHVWLLLIEHFLLTPPEMLRVREERTQREKNLHSFTQEGRTWDNESMIVLPRLCSIRQLRIRERWEDNVDALFHAPFRYEVHSLREGWVNVSSACRAAPKVTSWQSHWFPCSTAVPKNCSNICSIKVHMVSISFLTLLFLLCLCTKLPYSKFLLCCAPSATGFGGRVRLKKHWNGRELNQFILYNKIHSTVFLISSSNTSQHQTLMREGFQLDTVWHWACFSVTFNCQR